MFMWRRGGCAITLQALTNVWWQKIANTIGCSETKFDQLCCTKHDKIIAHVFTMILHRTWKHNRPDVLRKDRHTNIDLCLCTKQLQNMENIPRSPPKQAIYFAVWYKNMIQKRYIGFWKEH